MVHLGGLTPPASQAKSGATPKRVERSQGGVSLSIVRVNALVERAISRLERRCASLLFEAVDETGAAGLANIELRFLSRCRSALSGLAGSVENDAVILETLQMAAHDTEAMVAELELNDVVRLRCLIRQAKTMLPELKARGLDCAEWLSKLNEFKSLSEEDATELATANEGFSDVATAIWKASTPREKTLLDHLLTR